MMNYETGEALGFCASHPSEEVIGVCASCLRERLRTLKLNKKRNSSQCSRADSDFGSGSNTMMNILYGADYEDDVISNDHDDCGIIKINNEKKMVGASTKHGDSLAVTIKREPPKKSFLWLAKGGNHGRSRIKERVKGFSPFRYLFHRFRKGNNSNKKKEVKRTECISHDDSFISIKLDNERTSWSSSTFPSASARPSRAAAIPSSSESSISDGPSDNSRRSWEGMFSYRRHSYYYDRDYTARKDQEFPMEFSTFSPYYKSNNNTTSSSVQDNCKTSSEEVNDNKKSAATRHQPVRWRTRMNGLFQMRWKMHEQGDPSSMPLQAKRSNNQGHMMAAHKIWGLPSAMYSSREGDMERHGLGIGMARGMGSRRMRATPTPIPSTTTRQSWIKHVTNPRWSFY